MSKDEACKVTSAGKHKERKPKKPHYIPRPWGKPYNYKCFQCPFTCMEKSHLYNHMKYSLCKNSLSLLIESDWPYKKGNILHPDQLRPFQQAHGLQAAGKEELEQVICSEEKQDQRRCEEEDGETQEEEEQGGREQRPEISAAAKAASRGESPATKRSKQPESDLLMADMLSLEDQLLRVRSAELEAQLRHYKIPKTCLTGSGLLPDPWRLFASSHSTGKAEVAQQQRVSGSIACYPPPTSLADQQDPSGLNLSVLGVGYPISPGWLSYMNPAGVAAQTPFAQLPFLASAAQLVPPAPGADRGLVPHRLYYPFLCEHSFGAAQSDAGKSLKTPPSGADSAASTCFQPKVGLWKVPALRPGDSAPPAGWVSPQRDSPDRGYRSGEKKQTIATEGKATCGLKRTGGPIRGAESPVEKQQAVGFTLDLLRNIQTAAADKHLLQISLQDPQLQSRPGDQWYNQTLISPSREAACLSANSQDAMEAGASESVASLLSDLSKALQEYQEAERRISHLETEDLPAQRQLWEHLSKIRSELSHIHQALERTAGQSDGPLDLSVKKEATDEQTDREDGRIKATETEEDEEDGEDERKLVRASLEKRKQSLDMLIKMSQASVANAEVLGLRSGSEALWPSRTTKCEADSSVLLCPDGRAVLFADMPTAVKPPKGPASLRRQEAQCPPSPLTPPDS